MEMRNGGGKVLKKRERERDREMKNYITFGVYHNVLDVGREIYSICVWASRGTAQA